MFQQLLWNKESVKQFCEIMAGLQDDAQCVAFNHINELPCKTGFVSPNGQHIHWDLAYVYDWRRTSTGSKLKSFHFYANVRNQLQKRFGDNVVHVLSLRGPTPRPVITNFFLAYFIAVSNYCFVLVLYHGMPCDGSGLPLLAGHQCCGGTLSQLWHYFHFWWTLQTHVRDKTNVSLSLIP